MQLFRWHFLKEVILFSALFFDQWNRYISKQHEYKCQERTKNKKKNKKQNKNYPRTSLAHNDQQSAIANRTILAEINKNQ